MHKRRNILIINDDSRSRKFLSEIARKKGYNILTEQDEKNGYDVAKNKLLDLIIISAVITGKKSIELCEKLKNSSKTKHLPVLVFADSQENIKSIEYYDKGVDYFITRPIADNELLRQIEILIEK